LINHFPAQKTSPAGLSEKLYENKIFPFNINLLRNHVFVGAIHELPCSATPYLKFSSFVVPAPGMGICQKYAGQG
jgi:hypothetical protein